MKDKVTLTLKGWDAQVWKEVMELFPDYDRREQLWLMKSALRAFAVALIQMRTKGCKLYAPSGVKIIPEDLEVRKLRIAYLHGDQDAPTGLVPSEDPGDLGEEDRDEDWWKRGDGDPPRFSFPA